MKKNVTILLSLVSTVGVIATGWLAAKETEKKMLKKNEKTEKKEKTKVEKILCFSKEYWKTLVCGGLTIASITTSTILTKKREASLIAVAGAVTAYWKQYEGKVKNYIGTSKNDEIKQEIADETVKKNNWLTTLEDGRILFHEPYCGYFYAYEADVQRALYLINKKLSTGYDDDYHWSDLGCTLKDFLNDCKAELIDKDIEDSELLFGWELDYVSEMASELWLGGRIIDNKQNKCKSTNFS